MRDILPNASIRITIPATQFFDRIATLAIELGALKPEKYYKADTTFKPDILNLRPLAMSQHVDLVVQLISWQDSNKRIRVEARARRWHGDNEPTYEMYAETLRSLLRSLISAYNQKYKTRIRLVIQEKDECIPKLSPKTQEAFDQFVASANMSGLHPLDWQKLYRFARVCHTYHVKTNTDDVTRLLVDAGFSEEYARDIASVYGHLRDFQRRWGNA